MRKAAAIILAILLASGARQEARAQYNADISRHNQMIDAYFTRCLNNVYRDLSAQTREEFCACTTAHARDALPPAQMETLALGHGAPLDKTLLATGVLGSCLAAPLQELTYKECMADGSFNNHFASENGFEAHCQCLSARMGAFLRDYGLDLMNFTVTMNPAALDDPAAALQQSPDFQQELATSRNDCLNEYLGK